MNPIANPSKAKPTNTNTNTLSDPADLEKLGPAILKLQDAIATMRRSVKDKTIVLLLHDMTGIGKREIQTLLDAVPHMATAYLR